MEASYVEKLKARKRRILKSIIITGMLLFVTFIALTLFGDSGILVNMRVNREYRALQRERDTLSAQNARLAEEIKVIKTKARKIEAISRREFGFGRPGEIIFYFPDDPATPIQKFRWEEPDKADVNQP